MNTNIRIASTVELRIAASHGRSAGFNRQLPHEIVVGLDPNGIHIVEPLMWHEHAEGKPAEPHIRCQVLLKEPDSIHPKTVIVDFCCEDLEALRPPSTV